MDEPKIAAAPEAPELDTDGGWDPYVTSLLLNGARERDAAEGDEDDGAPVMSFSRSPQRR
jgi:hypothetical protein